MPKIEELVYIYKYVDDDEADQGHDSKSFELTDSKTLISLTFMVSIIIIIMYICNVLNNALSAQSGSIFLQ